MRIAVVTPLMKSGEKGGAENLYEGLVNALNAAGHSATQVKVPVDESSFENILESYCKCFYLNLDEYDLVISTKAPTYMVRHRNHISYLLHTVRVFYDMFDSEMGNNPDGRKWRKIIYALDKYGLDSSRIKKHATIGNTVANRMKDADPFWKSIDFNVIYPAPMATAFEERMNGEFIFLPGRLHKWKRVDLVIRAMQYVQDNAKLLIAGKGDEEENLKNLTLQLGLQDRVQFLGSVPNETLLSLYSRSIVVPFVAKNEDFGYVTIEAFMTKKPVITCKDSGEAAYLVKDGFNGFITDPEPKKIADKINYFISKPEEACKMGENGYESVRDITWKNVVSQLIDGVNIEPASDSALEIQVMVTDMQPIEPAIGGGRLRLKGLYSNLPSNIQCSYIGTYDWRGEKYRKIKISDNFFETTIPLNEELFKLNDHLNMLIPGKTIIDVSFPLIAEASPEYLEEVVRNAEKADVIIFSHPWLYPSVDTKIDLKKKILIYDSQNCEYLLRRKILGDSPFARCLTQMVGFVEKKLCQDADMILACSEEDKELFVQCYGIDINKIYVTPNGVDVKRVKPVPYDTKQSLKERLNIKGPAALFFGSNYGPNIDAGKFIIDVLADECKNVTFVIAGSVGSSLDSKNKKNVKIMGIVSDEEKNTILEASDVAINPMFSGSGTNIKMFDYFAAGLPTVSTMIGARGIDNPDAFLIADSGEFPTMINRLLSDPDMYTKLSKNGRDLVVRRYDWDHISRNLGDTINRLYTDRSPYFSVIVATNRGGAYLKTLFDHLNKQTYNNFEVILVDSGTDKGDEYQLLANFKLCYIFKEGIGATKARNVGIPMGRGKVFAFTDDDCQPDVDWLYNAKKHFDQQDIVGIEGYVYTDETKIEDLRYRIVTNKGFEGLGFMTANLFIKSDVLRKIVGFDERFDKPHFREDTEFGWRALQYGQIPYAKDVRVYHPPLLRDIKGESKHERDYFFINDAMLFVEYPEMYVQLMKVEGHYKNNENYWKWFKEGCKKLENENVNVPYEYFMKDPEIRKCAEANHVRCNDAN